MATGRSLLGAAFSDDGGSILAADDDPSPGPYRQALTLTDLRRGSIRTLASRRWGVLNPVFSHDGAYVAFWEVEWDTVTNRGTDILWYCRVADGHAVTLHRGPARAKSAGVYYLTFSDDDRYLAMLTEPTSVVEIANPGAAQDIPAHHGTGWLDARHLLYQAADGVGVFDVNSGKSRPLIPSATQPVRLVRLGE